MKKVLVTGAGGFIGRHTLTPLLKAGYEVHAASLVVPGNVPSDVRWYGHNLLEREEIAALFETVRPEVLLHLAWYTVPGKFWQAEENRAWLQAGKVMLEAFYRHGGRRAVFAGTCAEYEFGHELCRETVTPLKPSTVYGTCKELLHQYADAYARQHGFDLAWGRVFHLYGPHEHPQRFVPNVICSLLDGEEARCTSGLQWRDYMHVRDVAGAFAALLLSSVTGPVNIASGSPVQIAEVAQSIARVLNAEERLKLGALPMREGEPLRITASNERLSDEVVWSPALSLEQGLTETIAWWKEQTR